MAKKHYPKGLDGRQRDKGGQIHRKRGDTHIGTLRKTYGEDFAKGHRSDTKLSSLLKDERVDSLDALLEKRKYPGPRKK